MSENHIQTDVLIVGGGPSGASAAISLLTYSNLSVTLVEQSDFNQTRVGEHVSASIFDLIGYLKLSRNDFDVDCFRPSYASKAYWGSDKVSTTHSIFTTEDSTFQMDRETFDFKLIEVAAERGATIFPRTKCMKYVQLPDSAWKISAQHPEQKTFTIHARYLVDATGRSGNVCRMVGAPSQKYDSLVGVGLFLDRKEANFEHVLESVEMGWWYAASLPDHKMVMTLFTDADLVSEHKLHQLDVWKKALFQTKQIRHLLSGDQVFHDSLWIRSAHTQMSDVRSVERFVAIGDAAVSFDPISSMGIGFAISSASFAAKHIVQELERGSKTIDVFQQDILKNFEQYRRIKDRYYGKERRWAESRFWKRRH